VLSSNGYAAELQGAWLRDGEKLQGSGVNLLAGVDERSMQLAGARIELVHDKSRMINGEGVFRLVTNGEPGEHYAVMSWAAPAAGQTTFSIYVRRSSALWVRLQLLDDSINGLIVDYALATDAYRATRIGKATKLGVEADKSSPHWRRIALSASLPASVGKIIIQLADPTGSSNFAGGDVALGFQAPMVEAGGAASGWCRPPALLEAEDWTKGFPAAIPQTPLGEPPVSAAEHSRPAAVTACNHKAGGHIRFPRDCVAKVAKQPL
jgi:hypothetical protein